MSDNDHHRGSAFDRRTVLRAGLAAAFAGPAGVIGAQAFTPRAIAPEIDFSQFPLCKTSSDAPPLSGAPRKLKLSWNAGSVCLTPLPVAIDHGFFQKQNLDVVVADEQKTIDLYFRTGLIKQKLDASAIVDSSFSDAVAKGAGL